MNSDATWHTLYTVQAYSETPIREHLFLPIVSLGDASDKHISWGATIPDKNGNYYYTSFSPAGYFLPWLFMRAFRLPVDERSLYLFNTVLYAASSALWVVILYMLYEREKWRDAVCLVGLVSYLCVPEVLHGMGVVYWHQSVMQVTFLMQLSCYLMARKTEKRPWRAGFYLLAFLNPYIEWTGFVANVGFAISDVILCWKTRWRVDFLRVLALGGVSIASLGCFLLHYMLRVDARALLQTMMSRFMARNVTSEVSATNLATGYLTSFLYLWLLAAVLLVWTLWHNRRVELRERHGVMFLLLAFPLLENLLMKQHALSYTYDRMKGAYALSLIVCELAFQLLSSYGKRQVAAALLAVSLACGWLNLNSYCGNEHYIWNAEYRSDNELLAGYINENYADSVLSLPYSVRGYINMLFGRGIYEGCDLEAAKGEAAKRQARYAVNLEIETSQGWNMYDLKGASVYDMETGALHHIVVANGEIWEE